MLKIQKGSTFVEESWIFRGCIDNRRVLIWNSSSLMAFRIVKLY